MTHCHVTTHQSLLNFCLSQVGEPSQSDRRDKKAKETAFGRLFGWTDGRTNDGRRLATRKGNEQSHQSRGVERRSPVKCKSQLNLSCLSDSSVRGVSHPPTTDWFNRAHVRRGSYHKLPADLVPWDLESRSPDWSENQRGAEAKTRSWEWSWDGSLRLKLRFPET